MQIIYVLKALLDALIVIGKLCVIFALLRTFVVGGLMDMPIIIVLLLLKRLTSLLEELGTLVFRV
jgi:hypothetical protein